MISCVGDLLLRNVPRETLDALKERARARSRSVQAEALDILRHGVEITAGESFLTWAKTVRKNDVDTSKVAGFVREMRDER